MKRAMAISLAGHLAVVGSVLAAGMKERMEGPPVRVYTVDIVGLPGGPRGGGGAKGKAGPAPAAAPKQTSPSAKSGVKVDRPPSKETAAPKGSKKPKGTVSQQPGKETGKGGGLGVGKVKGSGGMRLDGDPFPYPDYLRDLVERIEAHWQPPAATGQDQTRRATVFFNVRPDGTLAESRVETGSGLLAFDRAALEAVLQAAPLPALPAGFKGNQLGVHLDFEE